MKPAIKKLWVAALRSSEYKQARGALRVDDKFCCLGVLCNLHAQAHPEIAAKERDPRKYLGQKGYLPKEVQEWAGLDSRRGAYVQTSVGPRELTRLNDTGIQEWAISPLSFKKIAKLIEEQL